MLFFFTPTNMYVSTRYTSKYIILSFSFQDTKTKIQHIYCANQKCKWVEEYREREWKYIKRAKLSMYITLRARNNILYYHLYRDEIRNFEMNTVRFVDTKVYEIHFIIFPTRIGYACVCGRATIRLMPKLSSCFDVHLTAITFKKRKLDVKTTLVTTQIRRIISQCV